MGFRIGKHLIEIAGTGERTSNHAAAAPGRKDRACEEAAAVIALDGIEKKYAAHYDFSSVANRRLADLLSGRLGPGALKYRRSGTLSSVHFSKQVLVLVAPLTRAGVCSIPFIVEKYLHDQHPRAMAKFLLAAEFFDAAGKVLQSPTYSEALTIGHVQVLECKAQLRVSSYCNLKAPPGVARVLLSFMTLDKCDEVVLLSDFTISQSLPAVPITAWDEQRKRQAFDVIALEQECRAILPVSPQSEFVIQLSAFSVDHQDNPAGFRAKALVAIVEFFSDKAKRIPGRYEGTSSSKTFRNFVYMPAADHVGDFCSKSLPVPRDASWLRLRLVPWQKDNRITLNAPVLYGTLDSETARIALTIDEHSMDLLSAAEGIAARQGHLFFRRDLLQTICRMTEETEFHRKLKWISGVLRELDEGWAPNLPVEPSAPPSPSSGALRICHLHKAAYPYENSGGAIRNLNTVRSLKAAGMDPYVVLPLFYPFDQHDACGFRTRAEDSVPHFEFRWSRGLDSLPPDCLLEYNTLLTYSLVRAVGADVIHATSGFRGYELALQGMALREKLGIPLVYEVRALNEHGLHESGEDNIEAEYSRLRIRKENYCIRTADHVIAISESMRSVLIERGVSADRIGVVPSSVDESRFLQSRANGSAVRERHSMLNDIVVGYVSSMSPREGHDVLIHAIAELVASGLEAKCLLVGDGPERNRLEALAGSLGIAERIVFAGEIDHNEIQEHYRAMDLLVVPRRPDGGLDHVPSLALLEAMALGIPVIASDRPALREIVGNHERGMLFQPESVGSLLSILKDLIANPDRRRALADTARKWVASERTCKNSCARYIELYQNVIKKSAVGGASRFALETTAS